MGRDDDASILFFVHSTKGSACFMVKVTQSCLTLCDPMDYIVHGILQATILEWVAIPFSRGSPRPSNWTRVSCIAGGFFTRQGLPERCSINIYWMNEWIIFSLLVLYWLKVFFFFPSKALLNSTAETKPEWLLLPKWVAKETNIWSVAWMKSCDCGACAVPGVCPLPQGHCVWSTVS